ncbi:hypothetical protein LINPERPRIM_LOCUS6783 [Linum perenne]
MPCWLCWYQITFPRLKAASLSVSARKTFIVLYTLVSSFIIIIYQFVYKNIKCMCGC